MSAAVASVLTGVVTYAITRGMNPTIERLKTLLAERGLSQSDLAREASLDPSTINKLLSGARSPSLKTAIAIERVTGIQAESWGGLDSDEEVLP